MLEALTTFLAPYRDGSAAADKSSRTQPRLARCRCSNVCACPRSTGRPSGSTPSRSAPPSCAAIVLVDFWTLTHQLAAHRTVCPRVVAGLPKRRVGRDRVHTPEFSFEHEIDGVRKATRSGRSTTRSPSTTTMRSGAPSTTTTGRRSTSSTRTASSATTTSAKDVTSSRSASSRSCSRSSASSSPSRGSAWRRTPTGTSCGRPRRTSATGAASTSRHPTAPRSTNAGPTSSPSGCA